MGWTRRGPENEAGDKPTGRLQILVVEDEFLLALEVEAALIGFGCVVVGPFAKLGEGLDAARGMRLDGAVLDINLNGEMVYPLAEFLDSTGVPFVFLTGYVSSDLPERFRRFRRLQKPLHAESFGTLSGICCTAEPVAGRVKPSRNPRCAVISAV